jgi:hypothetical protein
MPLPGPKAQLHPGSAPNAIPRLAGREEERDKLEIAPLGRFELYLTEFYLSDIGEKPA